ncbi:MULTISPECIES: ParB/RepB/Spo0J family partition protein [Nostoc]|uniref:ParB-like partition protein n=1 Tax=Nostoc commune NIES-4072 TaxID=2005467 RepID=A0A2R5G5I8_NOSCO|nr:MULTISPECIES: ParB/RepB/Spo0J family partition protein [Nostoc]NEU83643.1 ParB/RepB/Spo0J family partition protein [Nostoc sp. UIC 10630]BBD70370.1 ParB-like partition protein [Nostoc commune HK-02]GBG23024.1 ParB-like partition protein [Nostoc commune NIES-4072]
MSIKRDKPYGRRLKGLEALIGESVDTLPCGQFVTIEKIQLSVQQPRRYFDPKKLEQLVQSVKEHGILEPLLVRYLSDDKYELVAGERRYRAASLAGLTEVPVIARSLNDQEALQLSLVENLQRDDLNPIEETEGILELIALQLDKKVPEVISLLYKMQNILAGKVTDNVISNSHAEDVKMIFTGLGLMEWESFTANRLPLLRLPDEILEVLRQGKIEYTKAKVIAKLKEKTERIALLEEAILQNLSLNEIRERLKTRKSSTEEKELEKQIDSTYKKMKKSKLWDNPKKRKKLELLFAQIEILINEDD